MVYESIAIPDERCSSNSTDDPARCKFTVFLPSSIAFEHFYNNTEYATNITQDLCRFRYVSEAYQSKTLSYKEELIVWETKYCLQILV